MASEDVKTSGEAAVSTIVNLAQEAKLAREGVKTQGPAFINICKSLVAGGVAGGVCDRDMDGRINQVDIKQAILLSASTNRLTVTHEEAQEHAASIMEVIDSRRCGYIGPNELAALLRATLPGSSSSSSARLAANGNNGSHQEVSKSKAEILFRAYWRRSWILLIWLIICFSLFTWKFIQYKHKMAFEVMGYCLSTAKGAAETLKFNMALILLPVCRNAITRIRRNRRINFVVPFNDKENIGTEGTERSTLSVNVLMSGLNETFISWTKKIH